MSESSESPAEDGGSDADAAQNRHQPQDGSTSARESRSQFSASSTSTQWPSAPASPISRDVTHLQDILDRALHDPFATHPEIAAHLKSNIDESCQLAARKIHDADVLLVVTGAGFSADSGLATYVDVADIDAYRNRGWRYRDLCKPPQFSDFASFEVDGDGISSKLKEGGDSAAAAAVKGVEGKQHRTRESHCNMDIGLDIDDMSCNNGFGSANEEEISYHRDLYYREHLLRQIPGEDDIGHPQYFYGFWGQCCNDYRRVKPHEGYDLIARWGRGKNYAPRNDSNKEHKAGNVSHVAQEIRKITHMLDLGDDFDNDSSDGSESFHFKRIDEEEPYYVSPNMRAGAFFVFTSNVDAHSFDVFESHEIRECHGNVEMWQCHNFACGTNATVNDGASIIDGTAGNVGDDERQQQEQPWQRRLWRLPINHHFLVDCNSMCAPYSKSTLVAEVSKGSSVAAGSLESPPASKRRKPSTQDLNGMNTSSVSSQGKKCSTWSDSDSGTDARAENDDACGTATILGGMMEDTLRNHLEKKFETSKRGKVASGKGPDSSRESNTRPAHVGDVHGKPRIFPLRYMYPPATDSTNIQRDLQTQSYFLPISAKENWPRCPRCHEAARPAVLMFEDLDWVYNLKQERRWQRWCQSVLKLCKRRSAHRDASTSSDDESILSDANPSAKGEEEDSEPSSEQKIDRDVPRSLPSAPDSYMDASSQYRPQFTKRSQSPLKITILEIGCGYNVPTCRVIAERLVGELSTSGGDATLVRINPTHPEADDYSVEYLVISIMEKGLVALKLIDEHICDLEKGSCG